MRQRDQKMLLLALKMEEEAASPRMQAAPSRNQRRKRNGFSSNAAGGRTAGHTLVWTQWNHLKHLPPEMCDHTFTLVKPRGVLQRRQETNSFQRLEKQKA